jgi:hypothetical protein
MKLLNAKFLVWAGATLTILSVALGAASINGYWAYFGGACGLSLVLAGALQVDWSK